MTTNRLTGPRYDRWRQRTSIVLAGMVAVHAGVVIVGQPVSRAQDQLNSTNSSPLPVILSEEGTLEGWALDHLGQPLPKVPVVVSREGRGVARSTTDKRGLFTIRHLPAGTHRVVAGPATADFEFHNPSSAPGSAASVAFVVEQRIDGPLSAARDIPFDGPLPAAKDIPFDGPPPAAKDIPHSPGGPVMAPFSLSHPRSIDTISRLPKPQDVGGPVPTNLAVRRLAQNSRRRQRGRFDEALVSRGRTAFQSACTECHDAARSTSKKKSLSAWRATVRRMAAKDGADIRSSDFNAIATYLASLSAPARPTREPPQPPPDDGEDAGARDEGDQDAEDTGAAEEDQTQMTDEEPASEDEADGAFAEEETQTVSISATISTLFRGADHNNAIENTGFFVDAWVGADWQPDGPLSGRVIACTSCHSDDTALNGQGFTFELVEATATLDLIEAFKKCPSKHGVEAKIKGGRFIVPFGAFAAMSHPGAYRTLTNPLIYNMGRRVFGGLGFAGPPRQPVLPMPYSDEGFDIHLKVPFHDKISTTIDIYAVNGFQQSGPDLRFFAPSRSYIDNNALPAMGGRVTVGNPKLRFGGSIMTGEAQRDGNPAGPIHYRLYGFDVTARFKDRLRLYAEYAMRNTSVKAPPTGRDAMVYGLVCEGEVTILKKPRLGLLGRYDKLAFRDPLFPIPSDPDFDVERATWGINLTLPGGSLLILNHEHWILPNPDDEIDVVGFRWVGTF